MSVPHELKLHHLLQLKYLLQVILPGAKWYLLTFMWMLSFSSISAMMLVLLVEQKLLHQIQSPVQPFELLKGKNKCIQELLHLRLKKLQNSSWLFIVQFRYIQIALVIATVGRLAVDILPRVSCNLSPSLILALTI